MAIDRVAEHVFSAGYSYREVYSYHSCQLLLMYAVQMLMIVHLDSLDYLNYYLPVTPWHASATYIMTGPQGVSLKVYTE